MMMNIKTTLILLLGILVLTLSACENIELPLEEGVAKKEPVIINEVSIPILNVKTLNPIVSKDISTYYLNQLTYESLVELDENLQAVALLAESWEYQKEGSILIFNLRRDVKWHDHTAFTANDVVFTVNTLLNNGRNAPSHYKKFIENVRSVSKLDDYTVKITFKDAYDNAVENFIFPIISQTHVVSSDNVYKSIENFTPVGTGAFRVSEIEKLKYIKLSKNEVHWKEEKPISDLIFKIVPSSEESIGLLEISDINMALSQSHDWEKYLEDKRVSIYDFISNEVEIIGFNFNNGLLKDGRIRKAIAYAIDQNEIINHIYLGTGAKSDNIYNPDYLGINTPTNSYAYNLEKSKTLLKEAGFVNIDEDIYLEDENGKEIEFKLLVNSENKNRVATAKIIKKSLDKIGVMTKIIYIGYDEYLNNIKQGKYDMFVGGWSVSPSMDFRFALHSKYNNAIRYKNEYLDYLLVELQRHLPQDEKQKVFTEITDILEEDLPYYTLLYKEFAIIAKDDLAGNVKPNIMNIYNGAENWQIQKHQ